MELILIKNVFVEADDSGSIDGSKNDEAQLGAPTDVCIETTIPKQGQNLWLVFYVHLSLRFLV